MSVAGTGANGSLRVRVAAAFLIAASCFLLLEAGFRVVLSRELGPDILWYGLRKSTDTNVHIHENVVVGSYSKYRPNDVRRDRDGGKGDLIDVRINNHGFRGPDFEVEKAPGVFRIVALGASSTFGYHAPDDQTYPVHLENELSARCPSRSVEVINLGIPHLDSEQIVALFLAEGLRLDPDVVTYYEGVNDAQGGSWRAPERPRLRSRVTTALKDHFVVFAALKQAVAQERALDGQGVSDFIRGKSERFLNNLDRLRALAAEHDFTFVPITQQASSAASEAGETFEDDVESIRSRLESNGSISHIDATLLAHADIMASLRSWARANEVMLVDGIHALDPKRDLMTSWVHLSGPANRILATAIADQLEPEVCRSATAVRQRAAIPR